MGEIISEGRLAQRESVMRLRHTARALQFGHFMNNLRRKNYMNTFHFYLYVNQFCLNYNVM